MHGGGRAGRGVTARPLYTPAARDDLREIGDFIGQDNPARALSFVRELREHCRRLAAQPRLHRLREEFGPGVRGAVHGAYRRGSKPGHT